MNKEQIEQLAKIDLHCHLDGSLTLQCVSDLLGRQVELSELQVSQDCKDLATYLEKFEVPLACLQTEKGLQKASYEFLKEVAKENIRYIEVRFAPLQSVNASMNCEKVIASVLEGLQQGKENFGVAYNVIACAMRHHTLEDNLNMLKHTREFLGNGVCAIDLAGNEAAYPMKEFVTLFAEAKKQGFPFTIHAGECGNVENIIEAVNCGAKRIGHGIALWDKMEAIHKCVDQRIGIEMCPYSNIQTKAVKNGDQYPMKAFLDAGLLVTINTDNRMVSNTTITKEIQWVQQQYGITDEEVQKMISNAVEVSFADDALKAQLRKAM